jgi:hypothetical protein
VATWGRVPEYGGRGRPPSRKQAQPDWHYLQVMLRAACAWEDWVYNLTRPLKTLRLEVKAGSRRWQARSPAMAAGLTDHIWTVKELLMTVVAPAGINTK